MTELERRQYQTTVNISNVRIVRKCPYCGRKLYEKLGQCNGMIQIKCQKCGKFVNMNLALRRTRTDVTR